jgi:hypothetical protein
VCFELIFNAVEASIKSKDCLRCSCGPGLYISSSVSPKNVEESRLADRDLRQRVRSNEILHYLEPVQQLKYQSILCSGIAYCFYNC